MYHYMFFFLFSGWGWEPPQRYFVEFWGGFSVRPGLVSTDSLALMWSL